jgi:Tol biopolymer transport system component
VKKLLAITGAILVSAATTGGASPATSSGTTFRVAVSSTGQQGNGESWAAGISSDGRYVAFTSRADNLAPGDTNGKTDAFVRDLQSGVTERVSVSGSGTQGNFDSAASSISADGRYVVFDSNAFNLVTGDLNDRRDVFLRDRQTGRTSIVSVSSRRRQGNADSSSGMISANGRYVAFVSSASNLVPRDTNHGADVFVRDLKTSNTFRVDVGPLNRQSNRGSDSGLPAISATGRFVAFVSNARNLVAHDTNGIPDVFVRDLRKARTTRVSVSSAGRQARDRTRNGSTFPSISADGRYVAFGSAAANLVPRDTNRQADVFLRDRKTGKTYRVSVSSAGVQANGESRDARISADGRYVALTSFASDLAPGADGAFAQVFVRDLRTRQTSLASAAADGGPGDDYSEPAGFDASGRYLAFTSYARNLVPGVPAGQDAYVRDLGAPPSRAQAAAGAADAFTAGREQTFTRLVRPGDRLVYRVWIQTPVTGTVFVRGDRMARFRRLPLKVKGQFLSTGLPARLFRGRELLYYAVVHDKVGNRSVRVPGAGAQRAWIVRKPVVVNLGRHRFGGRRPPGTVVARATGDQVGWDIGDGNALGPQTFQVGVDRSIWLQDSFAHRLLIWSASRPASFARAVPLPGYTAQGDIVRGPAGSFYLSAPGDLNWPAAVFRLSADGEVLWSTDLPEELRASFPLQLRLGPEGVPYCFLAGAFDAQQGEHGWLPVATPDGRPLSVADQLNGIQWGSEPVARGRRLVAESYTARPDAPIHQVRVAVVDRRGRVSRAWVILSSTKLYFPGMNPELVGGDPVVVLDFLQEPQGIEHLVLRLGAAGTRARLSLADGVYGQEYYPDLRIGPDSNLYQLFTSPSRGVVIRRYSLATS